MVISSYITYNFCDNIDEFYILDKLVLKNLSYYLFGNSLSHSLGDYSKLWYKFPGTCHIKYNQYIDLLTIKEYNLFFEFISKNFQKFIPSFPYNKSLYFLFLYLRDRSKNYCHKEIDFEYNKDITNVNIAYILKSKEDIINFYNSLILLNNEWYEKGISGILPYTGNANGFYLYSDNEYSTIFNKYYPILMDNLKKLIN